MKFSTKDLTQISLFTAVTIILSQIIIPINPVPISLSMIAIFLSGAMLGWKKGVISQLIYIFLGAIGLPVFAGFHGGISVLFGPTGGYLIGYVTEVFIIGIIMERTIKKDYYVMAVSMILGLSSCYLLGTIWLASILHLGFAEALAMGVLPYIPGDLIKILVSAYIVKRIGRYV